MSSLPVGPAVTAQPALPPQAVPLKGRYVTLAPLAEAHISPLFTTVGQPRHYPSWTYMLEGSDPFPGGQLDFEQKMRSKIGPHASGACFWVIELPELARKLPVEDVESPESLCQGHLALWRMDLPNRVIEIAHVMFGEMIRGKREGTEVRRSCSVSDDIHCLLSDDGGSLP